MVESSERRLNHTDQLLVVPETRTVLTRELAEKGSQYATNLPDDLDVRVLPRFRKKGNVYYLQDRSRFSEPPEPWKSFMDSLDWQVSGQVTRAINQASIAIFRFATGTYRHRRSESDETSVKVGDFRRLQELIEQDSDSLFFYTRGVAWVAKTFARPGVEETWPKREKYVPKGIDQSVMDKWDEEFDVTSLGRALSEELKEVGKDEDED